MSNVAQGSLSSWLRIQQVGRFMSGMVIPNLGAFIAWGLITALFIPMGWLPNEKLSMLVGPMITYLIRLLIGFTGGKMIWGIRGGVGGAVAGVAIKLFDEKTEGKIPAGFEMLVANFSAGIISMILALIALLLIQPVVAGLMGGLQGAVGWIVERKLLPRASLFIEPGKILFLNNAINHGVLGPLGIAQVAQSGKSVMFLLEGQRESPRPRSGHHSFRRRHPRDLFPVYTDAADLGSIGNRWWSYRYCNLRPSGCR